MGILVSSLRFGAATVALALTVAEASAATILTYPEYPGIVALTGTIQIGDADRLRATIEAAGQEVRTLLLMNSRGGNAYESVRMAELVLKKGLRTRVARDFGCASGCFVVFAAGRERIVERGCMIGVHAAAAPRDGETTEGLRTTVIVADFLRRLTVSERVIAKMLATPHDKITWLDDDDLRSMGVTFSPQ